MKNKKGKLAKKRMSFRERKLKAEKWLSDFNSEGGKDIIKCYCKKFAVDRLKAVDELQRLGVKLTKEQIEKERKAVNAYQQVIVMLVPFGLQKPANQCRPSAIEKYRDRLLH